ncbi:hypothetical protein VTO42DRAFT_6535 [Malbranchea cinnamomea]
MFVAQRDESRLSERSGVDTLSAARPGPLSRGEKQDVFMNSTRDAKPKKKKGKSWQKAETLMIIALHNIPLLSYDRHRILIQTTYYNHEMNTYDYVEEYSGVTLTFIRQVIIGE